MTELSVFVVYNIFFRLSSCWTRWGFNHLTSFFNTTETFSTLTSLKLILFNVSRPMALAGAGIWLTMTRFSWRQVTLCCHSNWSTVVRTMKMDLLEVNYCTCMIVMITLCYIHNINMQHKYKQRKKVYFWYSEENTNVITCGKSSCNTAGVLLVVTRALLCSC